MIVSSPIRKDRVVGLPPSKWPFTPWAYGGDPNKSWDDPLRRDAMGDWWFVFWWGSDPNLESGHFLWLRFFRFRILSIWRNPAGWALRLALSCLKNGKTWHGHEVPSWPQGSSRWLVTRAPVPHVFSGKWGEWIHSLWGRRLNSTNHSCREPCLAQQLKNTS